MPSNAEERRSTMVGCRLPSEVVADNLRMHRGRQRLSQERAATRMRGLGHTTWSDVTWSEVERYRRRLTVDELVALAVVVGVSVSELLDDQGIAADRQLQVDVCGMVTGPAHYGPWLRGEEHLEVEWRDDGRPNPSSAWFQRRTEDQA